jgi:hypothetical protein
MVHKQRLRVFASLALVTISLGACGGHQDDSVHASALMDIYRNDNETRRPATAEQVLWTVRLTGCTGSMLDDKHLLTAAHCSPSAGSVWTSGACLATGCTRDLRAVRRLESNTSLDYAIMEVEWTRPESKRTQKYPPMVQTKDDQITFGRDGAGTEIFTVGFPADKPGAQHAIGTAKAYRGNSLIYNIGIINGNSGGAVWRTDNFMLVSQTNFGPRAYRQPGWNNNDPEDQNAWNGGGKMSAIYAVSAKMRQIFPGGINPKVDETGTLRPELH